MNNKSHESNLVTSMRKNVQVYSKRWGDSVEALWIFCRDPSCVLSEQILVIWISEAPSVVHFEAHFIYLESYAFVLQRELKI